MEVKLIKSNDKQSIKGLMHYLISFNEVTGPEYLAFKFKGNRKFWMINNKKSRMKRRRWVFNLDAFEARGSGLLNRHLFEVD